MPTEMCINLMPYSLAETKTIAEVCESSGLHSIGIADSPMDANRGEVLLERAKRLGVYDWLVSRMSGLFGTPDDVSRRLAELRARGLERWCIWSNPERRPWPTTWSYSARSVVGS